MELRNPEMKNKKINLVFSIPNNRKFLKRILRPNPKIVRRVVYFYYSAV